MTSLKLPQKAGSITFTIVALAFFPWGSCEAAEQKYWELSPYRVRLQVAVDDSLRPRPELGPQVLKELEQKIRATVYPLWTTTATLATGTEKHHLRQLLDQSANHLSDSQQLATGCEKQIFLSIVATPLGFALKCREFDCTTRRWGSTQQIEVRQKWMLVTRCFNLVCQTFAPLATIRPQPDNDSEVILSFRGSDLPRQTDLGFFSMSGEAYQPMMLRMNSAGEIQADSIREIPWTYLTLGEKGEVGWQATIFTGTRRPFGARRRGRIEHLALAVRQPHGPTKVRFHARHKQTRGLAGYEVFRRESNTTESTALGLTDANGTVEVTSDQSRVALLFLRSEGQLLAKVPVVPGAKEFVDVPVADDTARLRAQASLTSLTEQLIDTVALRNILIARVRDRLNEGELEQAQDLFTQLDDLPGRAHFDQLLSSAENRKLNRSDDPKIQARIDKLFADTRKLLGRFLSTRQISALQSEIIAARRENSG